MHHDRAAILPPPPIEDPITSEGARETDPAYYSDAPPTVPLDEDERRMLAEWERVF